MAMKFLTHKRRNPPSIIIVSLIDVLIVVLIFLMVTTTFKNQPSVKLTLPESSQAKAGAKDENVPLVVTIEKAGPIYLDKQPVSIDRLAERLMAAVKQKPDLRLAINSDTDAPFGTIIKVMDAAKAANIKLVSAFIKSSAAP